MADPPPTTVQLTSPVRKQSTNVLVGEGEGWCLGFKTPLAQTIEALSRARLNN